MKLTAIISILAVLNITANVYSQDKKLSIQVENIQLRDLFREIEANSEYAFFFNDQYSQLDSKVSFNSKDEKIENILDKVLKNTSLDYKILDNNFVVIVPKVSLQAISVTGKVTDSDGNSLPGVNIIEKGTTNGVISDFDGNYAISVSSPDAVLVFSFIGYLAEEIAVGNQSSINVFLIENIEQLDEVVVVGYGVMKKSDVTGAIVSVNEESLKDVPVANIQQALQGRAAGLEVQKIGTAPGATARIRIRGERSILGNNDPLIILDGIPFEGGSLNDIDQNAVASVEILKDASATAIYGSRGANGVILITTKRGKAGDTKVSYSGYYGVVKVARKYELFDAQEYATMRDAGTRAFGYMPEEIESMSIGRSTDWQELMYEDGHVTDHNITATGGNENAQFSIGGGYYNETTILPGQDFTRYSLRAKVDSKIGKRVTIGINTLNSVHVTNGSQFVNEQPNSSGFTNYTFGSNMMYNILSLSPLMPAYEDDGSINERPAGNLDDQASTYNPLLVKDEISKWVDRQRRLRTFNTIYGEVEIFKSLKYKLNIGLDYRQQEFDQFQGANSYFRSNNSARARVNNAEGWGYTIEHLLNFNETFAEKHNLSATALFSAQEDHLHNTMVGKEGVIADFIEFYDINQSDPNLPATIRGAEQSWGLLSYMIRINYNYESRYLLTLTGRADGSSRLAEKWHYYPAVSLGWNIHNEKFLKNLEVISNLKLRAGYGETSNQAVNPYTTLGGVSPFHYQGQVEVPIRYNYGTNVVSGYSLSTIPDETLDWEYTRTINVGLDFGVLANRISGTLEYYNAQTYNLLYNITLPPTSGVSGQFNTNIGEMENKGFEGSLSAVIINNKSGFNWSVDVNVFLNRNKILKLNGDVERNIASGLHVGQPLSAIYDYTKLGIWQLDEADEAAIYRQVPGQLKIADLHGNSETDAPNDTIDDFDKSVIGSGEAKWQGGLTNRFSYKGFDLSIVTYARFGGKLVSYLHQPNRAYVTNLNGLRNGLKVDYWTPDNPTNWFTMPQPANNGTITPPEATTAWQTFGYYDASFVKIRSISLGYSLPEKIAKKMFVNAIKIYVTAQNPFLLYSPYVYDWNGVDPEPTGTGNMGAVGTPDNLRTGGNNPSLVIGTSTPPTKSYIFGIDVTF